MSETPTPEPLKPDTEEEIAKLRRQLENTDRLLVCKNQEISELNSWLAVASRKISDAEEGLEEQFKEITAQDAELENLKSETERLKNKSAPTGKDLSEVEAADLLNKLKARRKKSKADLADIEAILEILDKSR